MATQKQRRRRAKEQRHDYEVVYVDADGNEVEAEAGEGTARKPPARASGRSDRGRSVRPSRGRGRRPVQPPSWPRVIKRGMIFAPIFLATVILLGGKKMTYGSAVVQTVLLIAVFVPFSYFMDRIVWRQYQKRLGKDA